ncbi:MAG: tRNA pseudouridine(55) synthase TruB [Erythrobacter sp.]
MTKLKPAPNGWIILDKPRGLGSTQAVAAVKRNLREGGYAKTKVGHGGTLDPLAEGVLPIALGEATKLAGRMLDSDKIYDFSVKFGEETATFDTEGEVTRRSEIIPSADDVTSVLPKFTGPIEQVPPAYSAIKVDGKRAYDRARAGEEVELKTRKVTIHGLDLLSFEGNSATLRAHVSKGTYIRSLARDIARELGSCGHVTYLRRIKAVPFDEKQAISLDNLNEIGSGASLIDLLLPLEAGLDDIPALHLDQTDAQAVQHGRVLSELPQSDGLYCAMLENTPVALVNIIAGSTKVVRGFNLPDVAE